MVEQTEAVGHSVRAAYQYTGMADVAALTGDAAMLEAADRGFIIANPHGTPMPELAGEEAGRVSHSILAGPAGWSESVTQALQEIDTLTDAGMTRG